MAKGTSVHETPFGFSCPEDEMKVVCFSLSKPNLLSELSTRFFGNCQNSGQANCNYILYVFSKLRLSVHKQICILSENKGFCKGKKICFILCIYCLSNIFYLYSIIYFSVMSNLWTYGFVAVHFE